MSETERAKLREQARVNYRNRVALKKERESTASRSPTPEDSLKNWREYRATHGLGPTAEESLKNWKAYREAQSQTDANSLDEDRSKTKDGMDHGL
ncbi:MAG: hypothetical protein JSR66_31725 [Proteobacteria bacterium]|nr:hypothetical protein [Pseudomonadota bacterium]